MKRIAIACLALLFFSCETSAAAKSITCTYLEKQELTFDVPQKRGSLPSVEFDYPSKVTRFSFRNDHLLLIAMDEADETRVRIVISARLDKAKRAYGGQIVADSGGNQLMLDSGPVTCKVRG